MKRIAPTVLLWVTMLALVAPSPAQQAAWSPSVGVAVTPYSELLNPSLINAQLPSMNITPDGMGGMIVSWSRNVNGNFYVTLQRLDPNGSPQWGPDGVQIGRVDYGYRASQCVGDGSGGAYVGWTAYDYVYGLFRSYIQHVSPSGAMLWGAGGASLTGVYELTWDPPASGSIVQMISDNAGGVFVSYLTLNWQYTGSTFRVARIYGNGSSPIYYWNPVTVLPCSAGETTGGGFPPVLATDGAGGVYVAGMNYDFGAPGLRYQVHVSHVLSNGTRAWDVKQDALNDVSPELGFSIVGDDAGVIVMYEGRQIGSNMPSTRGFRLSSGGTLQWGPKSMHNAADQWQYYVRAVSDGNHGAYYVLTDFYWYSGLYLQHVGSDGTLLWQPGNRPAGVHISSTWETYAQLATDDNDNVLCTRGLQGMLTLGKYSADDGSILWGTTLTTANGMNPMLIPDGMEGAFCVWNQAVGDEGDNNVYAQHVVDMNAVPIAKLDATEIDLGPRRVGVMVPAATTIANVGHGLPLTILNAVTSFDLIWFAFPTIPATLNAGTSSPVQMYITPQQNGPFVDTLILLTNDPVAPEQKVVLRGTGVYPHVTLPATSMLFRTMLDAPVTELFTVMNTGTDTLRVYEAEFDGSDYYEFSVDWGVFPMTLAPGASGQIPVTFAPTSLDYRHCARLYLYSNEDSTGTIIANLRGRVFTGQPQLETELYIQAGERHVGTTRQFTTLLANHSGAGGALVIDLIRLGGAFPMCYRLLDTPSFPVTLWPGETLPLTFEFTAVQGGSMPAALEIFSNLPERLTSVPIVGTGLTSRLAVSGLDFGHVRIDTCGTQLLGVTNYGTADLHITGLTVSGENFGDFTATGPTDLTLAPGIRATIAMRFCPIKDGPERALVTVTSGDGDTVTADLRGWGGQLGALRTVSSGEFGLIAIDQEMTRTFTIENVSDAPTSITATQFNGKAIGNFVIEEPLPIYIAPGDSATLSVTYSSTLPEEVYVSMVLQGSDSVDLAVMLHASATERPFRSLQTALHDVTVNVGEEATDQLVLSNITDLAQNIVRIDIRGADASAYAFTRNNVWPIPVIAHGTATFSVRFTPNDTFHTRDYPASLVILQATGDTIQVPLRGRGMAVTAVRTDPAVPAALRLEQNYPNPFAAATQVEFALPTRSRVDVVLYDLMGRELQRFAAGVLEPGVYHQTIGAEMLTGGVYWYELRAGGNAMRRMMRVAR